MVEKTEFSEAATDTPEKEEQAEPVGEKTEEEVDWKAKAEAAEAEQAKLLKQLNDTRSQRVNHLRQAERDSLLQSVLDEQAAQRKSLDAYVRSTATGDTEGLPAELERIETESQETRQLNRFRTRYNALWAELNDAVKDEEGNEILDLHNAPELEQVRVAWNEGQNNRDEATLLSALTDANKAVLQAERKRHKSALAEAEKTATVARREAEEKEDDEDDDLGPGVGAGEKPTKDNIDLLYSQNPDKYERQYREFLRTGRI